MTHDTPALTREEIEARKAMAQAIIHAVDGAVDDYFAWNAWHDVALCDLALVGLEASTDDESGTRPKDLQPLEAAAPTPEGMEEYVPSVVVMEDSGISEFVMFDRAVIHEETWAGYQVLRDMESREVIGFAWPTKHPPKMPPHHIDPDTRKVIPPTDTPPASDLVALLEQIKAYMLDPDGTEYHSYAMRVDDTIIPEILKLQERVGELEGWQKATANDLKIDGVLDNLAAKFAVQTHTNTNEFTLQRSMDELKQEILDTFCQIALPFRNAATAAKQENERLEIVADAARLLIADVRRRYPGEDLRCPYMIALNAALATEGRGG